MVLAVLSSRLAVCSAACRCRLAALCLWLSDCILYPDKLVGGRLLARATRHAGVAFLRLGWPCFLPGPMGRAGSHRSPPT